MSQNLPKTLIISRLSPKEFGHTREKAPEFLSAPMARFVRSGIFAEMSRCASRLGKREAKLFSTRLLQDQGQHGRLPVRQRRRIVGEVVQYQDRYRFR